jgi:hypothetical protein
MNTADLNVNMRNLEIFQNKLLDLLPKFLDHQILEANGHVSSPDLLEWQRNAQIGKHFVWSIHKKCIAHVR